MLKKIKQIIIASVLGLSLATPFALVGVANGQADIQGNLCQGTDLQTGDGQACENSEAGTQVNDLVADIINIFSWVVGVVSVIMIIVGGFQYITSGGDSNKVGTAKNTILYAIIGLVVVALAQIIVRFVLSRVVSEG